MRKIIVKAVSVAIAAVSVSAFAGELVTGDAAIAKFPASLQAMGLHAAKWMQLTNGVEYYYGRFTNMLGNVSGFTGSKNDLHMLRIDYKRAPVKMKFVDHTQTSTKRRTTSWTAAQHNALFAINMTMEYREGTLGIFSPKPQGYAKADGAVIPNGAATTGTKAGFAFNDDKTYKFEKDWTVVDPATGNPKADAWDNVVTHEAYTIHDGVPTWGASATYFTKANYTFFGTTADGVLWACAVDGRREGVSDGLAYHEVAALQLELGCTYGVCCDGGGSTTMAIRKDLMTVSDICDTQRTSSSSQNYYTMCYLDDGSERAVINQLLFVEGPEIVDEVDDKVVKSSDTLVFMGDSITEFGKNRTHGYVNLVVKGLAANGINPTWYGVGVQGDTSINMLDRFDRDVISKNPTVVTISAGVNDIHQSVAYATYCQKEREMVAKAKNAGAKVVMLSPTTAGYGETDTDELRKFVGGVKEIAADEGLAYAPTYEHFRAWMNDVDKPVLSRSANADLRITCDTVHMSPAGDRQMARAVLKSFGLDMDELSAAEAAWNADDTLVPLIVPPSSTATISVNLTAAEEQAVSGLMIKQILDRGIPSLAANPTLEAEASGASVAKTVTPTSCNFSYRTHDQLVSAAAKLGIRVDEAVKCAILRGARNSDALSPSGPIAMINDVLVGSDMATFDATIESVGATAGSCDVLLRYGTSANSLGSAKRVAVGEIDSFHFVLKNLEPNTAYFYEATFVNNATTQKTSVISGSFKTKATSSALKPVGGEFETDTAAIQAAIDAAAPSHGTVTLGEGYFTLGAELMVTGGVALVGQGMTKTIIRQTAAHRVMTVKDASRVVGVTIEGGKTTESWYHGAGAYVLDGTISRCRVWHNNAEGRNVHGGGVHIEKGTIDHSIVAFNKGGTYTSSGGGIGSYNKSNTILIDACLVYGNTTSVADGGGKGGGICLNMGNPDVTIRNTTVSGNSVGGLYFSGSKVKLVNSIVSGNTAGSGDVDVSGTLASGSSNNLVGGSPAFVSAANNDYHLAANSPAKGAGVAYEGIGADLDGVQFANPPSIGCYEYDGFAPPVQKRPRVMFSID